jgi:hypothetical protein
MGCPRSLRGRGRVRAVSVRAFTTLRYVVGPPFGPRVSVFLESSDNMFGEGVAFVLCQRLLEAAHDPTGAAQWRRLCPTGASPGRRTGTNVQGDHAA